MEPDFSNQQPPDSVFEPLSISHDGGNYLNEASRWCRFLAIVGLIGLGIVFLILIASGSAIFSSFEQIVPGFNAGLAGSAILAIFAVVLVFAGGMLFLLLRFATLTRRALQLRSQELFGKGISSLKLYFIIYGVLAVLGLLSNALSLFK